MGLLAQPASRAVAAANASDICFVFIELIFISGLFIVSETVIRIGTSPVVVDAWISVKTAIEDLSSGGDSDHLGKRRDVPQCSIRCFIYHFC